MEIKCSFFHWIADINCVCNQRAKDPPRQSSPAPNVLVFRTMRDKSNRFRLMSAMIPYGHKMRLETLFLVTKMPLNYNCNTGDNNTDAVQCFWGAEHLPVAGSITWAFTVPVAIADSNLEMQTKSSAFRMPRLPRPVGHLQTGPYPTGIPQTNTMSLWTKLLVQIIHHWCLSLGPLICSYFINIAESHILRKLKTKSLNWNRNRNAQWKNKFSSSFNGL